MLMILIALGVYWCHDSRTEELLPFARHRKKWRTLGAIKLEHGDKGFDAKIIIDKYVKGQESYPSIYVRIPKKTCDWRSVESLEFEAVADHPDAYLSIRIHNGNDSQAYGRQPISTTPSKIRINIQNSLSMKTDTGDSSQLLLYQHEPERTCTIWLSNIRITYRVNFHEYFLETHRQLELCPNPQEELVATDRRFIEKPHISFEEWRDFHDELKRLWITQFERQMMARGNPKYSTLWVSPMDKVCRTDNPLLSSCETLALEAARGEGESAQLVVYAKQYLRNLKVRLLKPPTAADGGAIPALAVTVTPVGYVACPKPPYRTSRNGWWPDPLLVYADSMSLESGVCEPWWVDANVPKDQSPGTYNGILRVSADNAPETDIPFSLTVHRFTLPDGSAYPLAVTYHGVSSKTVAWSSGLPDDHPSKTRTAEWNRSAWDMMLSHRIGCDSLYHTQPVDAADAKYKLDRGARFFNICYLDNDVEKRFPDIDQAIEDYKRLGILDKAYFYGFDEAPPQTFAKIAETIKTVRKRYPGIPIFTTAVDSSFGNDKASPLHDCVDWWCPVSPVYAQHFDQIAPARAHGRQVWWYICCYPTQPYANIFIEFPGIQARLLLGMMHQKFKPDGFLYWAVTNWRHIGALRNTPMKNAPCTNWTGNSFRLFNGDGVLLYPGETQILPTLRLKLLRDGMEDALYFQLLEKALKDSSRMTADWRRRATHELHVEKELVASMTEFTDGPKVVEAKRSRLARLLNEYESAAEELPKISK